MGYFSNGLKKIAHLKRSQSRGLYLAKIALGLRWAISEIAGGLYFYENSTNSYARFKSLDMAGEQPRLQLARFMQTFI